MAFIGLNPEAQHKFNLWGFSDRVIDDFVDGARILTQMGPSRLPSDADGLFIVVDVDDPQDYDPEYGLIFNLRIRRNDADFWVFDIHCTGVRGNGDLAWSSKRISELPPAQSVP